MLLNPQLIVAELAPGLLATSWATGDTVVMVLPVSECYREIQLLRWQLIHPDVLGTAH